MSKKIESSRSRRKAQTTLETYFLLAAEKGDVQLMEETMELLKVDGSAEDLNFMNKHDKTALQLAIEYGHKVDNDYLDAVETLLGDAVDKKQDLDERGFPKIVNKPVERDNEDFQNDMCPMVLAAHRNHYEIIQTLLRYGAHDIILNEREFQSDDIEWQTEKHTVERSLGLLNFYKAISSPAYIAITELNKSTNSDKSGDKKDIQNDQSADKDVDKTDKASFEDGVIDPQNVCDPFGKAFELSSTLKEMSETEYEFSKDYLELSEQCEDFAADLLGQTRHTKDELHTVLAHDSQWKTEDIISGDRPSKVIYAVEKEQKKFVAHPHCQQELITRWYGNGSLQHWRDKTTSRNVVISMTIMLFFPILSLLYYFVPFGRVKRFMRTPYVKFLMHTASYVFFLILLLMSTVDFSTLGIGNYVHRLIIQQLENQQRGPPFSVLEKLIFIWILAMTWREIKELWNEGLSSYINDPWNWIDWVQLLLYWCWVAFRVWAIVEVALERNEQDMNETIPATAYSSHMESHLVTKIQRFNNSDDFIMLAYYDSDNQTENSNITYLNYEAELFLNSTTSPTNDTTNTSTSGHMTTEYQSTNDAATTMQQHTTQTTKQQSTQYRTTIHTSPEHTTPHETTFHMTSPEHTTPHRTTMHTTTPEHTTPRRTTFHTTTPEHTTPNETTFHTTTPEHTTQHETTFHMTTPEHTTPRRTTFHTTTPEHTTPNETTYHTTTPEHTTSHRTTIHTTPKPSTRHRTTIHRTPHDTTTRTTVTPRRTTPPSYPLSPVVKEILDHVSDEHVNTRIHAKVLAYNVTGMVLSNISQIIQEIEFPSECEESLANVSQALDDLASEIYYWLPTERPTIPDDVEPTDSEYDDISYSSPRSEWDSLEPTLLADCVLACATVISVIRFLRVMVINEQVGPMQISFSKMITDVILFLVMFSVLWVAFALGMTQIYWSYAADEEITCLREGGSQSECSNQPYGNLLNSMATLFWSLFGLVELDTLEVEPDHSSTEFFGELLYALFQLTAVIILLNLLIAFMGTTYDNVSENSDVEWKFYRSQLWMAFFRRGATLPPPFNIIPSPKSIVRFCCFIYYNILCRKRGQMRKKKQTAKIIAKHEDYMATEVPRHVPMPYREPLDMMQELVTRRPMLDLSHLNSYIRVDTFRIERMSLVRRSLQQGEWATTIDLKDAYAIYLFIRSPAITACLWCVTGSTKRSRIDRSSTCKNRKLQVFATLAEFCKELSVSWVEIFANMFPDTCIRESAGQDSGRSM
ncbi:short transient receptor potential channel 4-like [Ptychodera flava]|uniref:short transient receptor potential channel 4-like n=1 Tax=Ptychodera flava TaxID=63121 RepID=UPI00396A81EB